MGVEIRVGGENKDGELIASCEDFFVWKGVCVWNVCVDNRKSVDEMWLTKN